MGLGAKPLDVYSHWFTLVYTAPDDSVERFPIHGLTLDKEIPIKYSGTLEHWCGMTASQAAKAIDEKLTTFREFLNSDFRDKPKDYYSTIRGNCEQLKLVKEDVFNIDYVICFWKYCDNNVKASKLVSAFEDYCSKKRKEEIIEHKNEIKGKQIAIAEICRLWYDLANLQFDDGQYSDALLSANKALLLVNDDLLMSPMKFDFHEEVSLLLDKISRKLENQ
ncbi:hypothetical protein BJP34_08935 [Moorena producens PAL-8-15-08-1]|uniref:Uncharacterized protein n=1 Tax=Moorena producens PAL-8-15-08-1 TaxID=1458985 RepID=A0A1D8TPJ7_9CYAN|nr:hypothetical protein [Moorena producens]AOW99561.1 hypothetical protein BJP34_08935 [Moorena producens PAL-8-15-08-1]